MNVYVFVAAGPYHFVGSRRVPFHAEVGPDEWWALALREDGWFASCVRCGDCTNALNTAKDRAFRALLGVKQTTPVMLFVQPDDPRVTAAIEKRHQREHLCS